MKKIISLMLVLSVAFSALALSGCDGDKREENGQNTSSSSTKSSKTSQKKKEEEKPTMTSFQSLTRKFWLLRKLLSSHVHRKP